MRPSDWQERMASELNHKRKLAFAWGSHDCALFACDVAQAICGVDFAEPFRGKYKNKRGAYRALKQFAGGGLEQVAEKILAEDHNCEEVPVLLARRGDIVLAEVLVNGEVLGDSLGVCLGAKVAFATEKGFTQLPVTCGRRAWRTP